MSAFEIAPAEPATIALVSLTRDPDLSCRVAGVNAATVEDYAELYRAGVTLPPVVVFADAKGAHWLADGWHRCAAAELAGLAEVSAEVRPGGRREALLYAAGANAAHGLRRTNADKRRAVGLVLAACPKWSNRKVGMCAAGIRRSGSSLLAPECRRAPPPAWARRRREGNVKAMRPSPASTCRHLSTVAPIRFQPL